MSDKNLDDAWDIVRKWYFHPLLHEKPEILPQIPGVDTAHIDFVTTKINISQKYLDSLIQEGVSKDAALRGLLVHEVGHYSVFPRELSTFLFLSQISHDVFKDRWKAEAILQYYMDCVNDTDSLRSNHRRPDLSTIIGGGHKIQQTMITKSAPADRAEIEKMCRVDTVIGMYRQKVAGVDIGIKGDKNLEKKLDELGKIDFCCTDDYAHAVSLVAFGKAIEDLLHKPKQKISFYAKGGEKGSKGEGGGNRRDDKDGQDEEGGGYTHLGDITIDDFSEQQINEALNDIIKKHGKERYEMIKEHLKELTHGKFKDQYEDKQHAKPAGLEHSCITWNNKEIPYYDRLSSAYAVYIVKKPLKTDAKDLYPERNLPLEVGDPLTKVNPFSSPWILPGITQRREDAMGKKIQEQYRIPDLGMWLDTSGSMMHPAHKSYAVLAAFILAKNYHANNAKLFLANFSADLLLMGPTRDIELIETGLCAYWGGGTVLNIDKLRQYFELRKERDKDFKEVMATDAKAYEDMLKKMSHHEQQQFLDKAITVPLEKNVKELYERTDNVLISDGYIGNISELVGYMNSIARYSRNTLVLIGSENEYKQWSAMDLKNSTIILVNKPEDLIGMAIGKARKLCEETNHP